MSDESDPGCAVRADGTLKDASEIEWHFDPDDDTPIALSTPPQPPPPPTQSVRDVHPFFTGHMAAATPAAGARRSNRPVRPSARITDPNNAMIKASTSSALAQPSTLASSSIGEKRKASTSEPTRRVVQKVNTDSDGEGQTDAGSDFGDSRSTQADSDTESATVEEVQHEFETLQAMADDDHQVRAIMTFIISALITWSLGNQHTTPA